MKQLEERLVDVAFNKGYLTKDEVNQLSTTFNVSYNDVISLSNDLNIDVISKDDVLLDLKKIEKENKLKETNYPLLSKEEEIQLFKRLQFLKNELSQLNQQDPESTKLYKQYKKEADNIKMRIININMPLVMFIARKFNTKNLQYEDLLSEGKLGMIQALDCYNYNSNARFTTYAYYKIYQAIKRLIQNYDRSIRVPVHVVELTTKIIKTKDYLTTKYGKDPSNEEIAKELNIKVSDVDICLNNSSNILSLDKTIGDEDKTSLSDIVPDDLALSPYENSVKEYVYNEIMKVLNKLTERERNIFIYRYGLLDNKPRKLSQIGEEFDLSKERVRQILVTVKRKISQMAPYLKDYISGGKDGK